MNFFRRYWVAGLVLMMVGLHAVIIGYVRSQVARLKNAQSTAVTMGTFRIQPVRDPASIYTFKVHAVLDPTRRSRGEERLEQVRLEIMESAEQLLRQVEADWLNDPAQTEIRARLLEVVLRHINEPLVQKLLITDWVQAPITTISVNFSSQDDMVQHRATILP